MKKIFIILLACITTQVFAQEKTEKTVSFDVNGGVWFGMNSTTKFLGFIGPKLTVTFPVSKTMKLEAGVNGVPGLLISNDPKLGLAAGATVTLRHQKTKFKPVFGVMFIKTDKWQTLYGIGFLF